MNRLCTLALLLLLVGCAMHTPLAPQNITPSSPANQTLAQAYWTSGDGTYILKQIAILEAGDKTVQMEGVLRLNLKTRTARLVVLGGFGMKYFDMEITPKDHTVHMALPTFYHMPKFLNQAASTIQRLYLIHQPASHNGVLTGDATVLVSSTPQTLTLNFFDTNGSLLCTKSEGNAGQWTVTYEYSGQTPYGLPTLTTLTDHDAGYRLKLKLTSVKHAQ